MCVCECVCVCGCVRVCVCVCLSVFCMSRSLRCPSYVSLRHGHRVHDVSSSWCSVFLGVLVSIYTYVCVPASRGSVMVPGLSNMLLPLGSKMWLLENKPTAKSGNCSRTQNIILKNDAAQGVLVWSLLEVLQLTKLRCWVLCAVASCALLGSLGVARVRSVGVDDKKLGVPFRSRVFRTLFAVWALLPP